MAPGRTKIMYFAPDTGGGGISVLRDLLSSLDRTRYEPLVLFATGPDDPRVAGFVRLLRDLKIEFSFLGEAGFASYGGAAIHAKTKRDVGSWLEQKFGKTVGDIYRTTRSGYRFLRRDWSKAKKIARILKLNQIQLLHINGTGGSDAAMVAARWAGVPCVAHVHMFPKITSFHRWVGKGVNRFLYISTAVEKWCQDRGWAQGELVHNGVDLERFQPGPSDPQFRENWSPGDSRTVVGILGRVVAWKGQDVFIKAIAEVCSTHPEVTGVIVGETGSAAQDKSYFQSLQSLAGELGVADNIVFAGQQSDVPKVINSLDLVVHASTEPEPFGLVVIEAMAAAKPVIATGEGGVVDILTHQKDGLLVPPGDVGLMAQAIRRLVESPKERKDLAESGRHTAVEGFALHRQVQKIQQVYHNVLSETGKGADANPSAGSDLSPVFIIGGSRTGSEMLKTILTSGPDIDMINEMFLLCPRWLHPDLQGTIRKRFGNRALTTDDVDALVALLFSGESYGYFWTEIDKTVDRESLRKRLSHADLDLPGIFACLLEEHAKKAGKPICGAKFPVHYSYSEKLVEWFPNCKLVHTVRDPRAVYSSQMNKYVSKDYGPIKNAWIRLQHFVHIFIQVKWSTRIHRKLSGSPNYLLSKYEDLVTQPEKAIPRVCDFLGIEMTSDMLNPTQYNSSFKQNTISQGFDKKAMDGWRAKLSPQTVAVINALNRGELDTLGYWKVE